MDTMGGIVMLVYTHVKNIVRRLSANEVIFTTRKTHIGDAIWHLHTDVFWRGLATGVFARTPAFIGFRHSITGDIVGGYIKLSSKIKPTKYRLQKVLGYYAHTIIQNRYSVTTPFINPQGYSPFYLSKTKDKIRINIETNASDWGLGHMPICDFDFKNWKFKTMDNVQYFQQQGTYADGFFDRVDKNIVLVENEAMCGLSASATISVFDISDGWKRLADDIMPLGSHSSYPISFTYNNQVFCIPSIWDTMVENIPVWHRKSATQWQRYACDIILPKPRLTLHHKGENESNGWRQDFTPFYHKGVWYGFTSRPACDVVFLYTADTPFGIWTEHPMSPICVGVNGGRMAGNIFMQDTKIYRFGQDSTYTYGGAIMVFCIDQLSPRIYKETYIKHIETPFKAFHTFNMGTDKILFDYKAHAKDIH